MPLVQLLTELGEAMEDLQEEAKQRDAEMKKASMMRRARGRR